MELNSPKQNIFLFYKKTNSARNLLTFLINCGCCQNGRSLVLRGKQNGF